jgi:hypothetical protein
MFKIAPSYTAQDLAEWMREMFAWEIVEQLPESQRAGMRDRLLFQFAQARVEVDADGKTYEDLLKMGTVSIPSAGAGMLAAADGAPTRALRHPGSGGPVVTPPSGFFAKLSPLQRVLLGGGAAVLLVGAFAAIPIIKGGDSGPPVTTGVAATQPVEPDEFIDDDEPLNGTAPAATGPSGASGTKGAKAGPTPAPVKRRAGYLSCNSWPWSVVYLDKRRLPGNTPLSRVRVPEGNHRLRFVNPELGLSKEVPVTIVAGAEKTVAVKLDR